MESMDVNELIQGEGVGKPPIFLFPIHLKTIRNCFVRGKLWVRIKICIVF